MSRQQDYYNDVHNAAKSLGFNDVQASLAASQASLETGYGRSVKGHNHFGIKAGSKYTGKTVSFNTHEVYNGKVVGIKDTFRAYSGLRGSVKGYGEFMASTFPSAWNAPTFSQAVKGLTKGRYGAYATDPNYLGKINYIGDRFGKNVVANVEEDGPLPAAPIDMSQPPTLGFAVPAFAPEDRPTLSPIDGLLSPATGQPAVPTPRGAALAPFTGGRSMTGQIGVPSPAPGRAPGPVPGLPGNQTVNIAPGHSQSIDIDAMVAQNNAARSAQQFGVSGYTGQPTTAPTPARSVNSVRSGPVTAARGRAATAKGDFAALAASEISGPFSGSSPAVAAAKAVQSTRSGLGLDTIDAEDPRGSQISAPTSHTANLARSIGQASPASPVNAIDALDPRGAQIAPPSQSVAPPIAAPPTSRNVAQVAPSFAIPDDVPVPTQSPAKSKTNALRGLFSMPDLKTSKGRKSAVGQLAGRYAGTAVARPVGGFVGGLLGKALAGKIGNGVSGPASLDPNRSSTFGYSTPTGARGSYSVGIDGSRTVNNQYGVSTTMHPNGSMTTSKSKGEGKGNGGTGGDTYLCTVAYEFGWIDADTLAKDGLAGQAAPTWLQNWYSSWAKPWADVCRENTLARAATLPLVCLWAHSMAYIFNTKFRSA